ncbi:MAG: transposase [Proteobacteria bacterium]|nr:transposase [Pseudomonadota bacterium]
MENIFVGIDISLSFTAAIKANNQFQVKEFKNDLTGCRELLEWLKKEEKNEYYFCMEATGRYSLLLATFLYDQGHYVSVVNPVQIKYFMKSQLTRNKTDAVDAKMIAQFSELLTPISWQPEPVEVTQLRALINRLDIIEKLILQEKNRFRRSATPGCNQFDSEGVGAFNRTNQSIKERDQSPCRRAHFSERKNCLVKNHSWIGRENGSKDNSFYRRYKAIYPSQTNYRLCGIESPTEAIR